MESTKQPVHFHERPITDLRFHKDGDVFFTASKDCSVAVVNLHGKVLGSFEMHDGAISAIGTRENSLLTAGADLVLATWDIVTGKLVHSTGSESVVRGIDFGEQIYFCTDDSMNKEAFIGMLDPRSREVHKLEGLGDPATKIFVSGDYAVISTATGKICKFDLKSRKLVAEEKIHQGKVTDMKPSACRSFFATASNDSSARIVDVKTFAIKKQFDSEDPINSVAIFNTNDVLVCAGGVNARDVTTTHGKGSFDTNFFDIVTQEKVGYYATHFGTINAVDVHPQGKCYISGGEDSSVWLVTLGDDFRKAPFTKLE